MHQLSKFHGLYFNFGIYFFCTYNTQSKTLLQCGISQPSTNCSNDRHIQLLHNLDLCCIVLHILSNPHLSCRNIPNLHFPFVHPMDSLSCRNCRNLSKDKKERLLHRKSFNFLFKSQIKLATDYFCDKYNIRQQTPPLYCIFLAATKCNNPHRILLRHSYHLDYICFHI